MAGYGAGRRGCDAGLVPDGVEKLADGLDLVPGEQQRRDGRGAVRAHQPGDAGPGRRHAAEREDGHAAALGRQPQRVDARGDGVGVRAGWEDGRERRVVGAGPGGARHAGGRVRREAHRAREPRREGLRQRRAAPAHVQARADPLRHLQAAVDREHGLGPDLADGLRQRGGGLGKVAGRGAVVAERDPGHAGRDQRDGPLADAVGVQLGAAGREAVGDQEQARDRAGRAAGGWPGRRHSSTSTRPWSGVEAWAYRRRGMRPARRARRPAATAWRTAAAIWAGCWAPATAVLSSTPS